MLVHDFKLLDEESFNSLISNFRKSNFFFTPNVFAEFEMSDKTLLLSMPLWKQINAWNYKNEKAIQGLAYHGITVFHPEQLKEIEQVVSNSLIVFSKKIIFYKRKKVRNEINSFLDFLKKGIDKNLYLVHEGI
ncbi:hypothetical protein [Treponema zioleckii]|uniref:hypothetical protein n=1 Tax=Treponema zioleckii TaxID=331680 RepID=UPI00168A85ED|nr:hypothetical protein [Treponema zioleckii]